MSKLRAGMPITVAGLTIVPVEHVQHDSSNVAGVFWAYCRKEPVCLILRDRQGVRAVDLRGREIEVEPLLGTVPRLAEVLAGSARP